MGLQFVFGGSGAGKSTTVYEKVIAQSMQHPEKNYLIMVPDQFTMYTQKQLCMMHPRGGIMNVDVLSFGRIWRRPGVSWRALCARAQASQAGVTSLKVTHPSLLPLWSAEVRC